MTIITGLTNDPLFVQGIPLPDGSTMYATFCWRTVQSAWFLDLSWNGSDIFPIQGLQITSAPNILRQWRNQIPFGLAFISSSSVNGVGGVDPVTQNDFINGAITLYLLNAQDVALVEETYYTKKNP